MQVHWHKGRAVEWLLKSMCEQMGLPGSAEERRQKILPIYIGDDATDEDAFAALRARGVGIPIIVRDEAPRMSETAAEFWLKQSEVRDVPRGGHLRHSDGDAHPRPCCRPPISPRISRDLPRRLGTSSRSSCTTACCFRLGCTTTTTTTTSRALRQRPRRAMREPMLRRKARRRAPRALTKVVSVRGEGCRQNLG
jgi:hypothetical protein